MFEDATRQMSKLPRPVQLWMRWLNIVLLPGFFFAFESETARWILIANLAGLPVGILAFALTRNIHMTGIPHILFWTPLLVYIPQNSLADPTFKYVSFYAAWLALYCATIATSLVFDVRAIFIYLIDRRRSVPGSKV